MGIFPNSFPFSDLIKLFGFFVVLSALQHVRVVGVSGRFFWGEIRLILSCRVPLYFGCVKEIPCRTFCLSSPSTLLSVLSYAISFYQGIITAYAIL